MNDLETKRLTGRIELKADSADPGAGTFTGYGSVFNDPHPTSSWMLDSDWKDVVVPGAFKKTLADHKARGSVPAMCLQHASYSNPIGVWRELKEDDHGLFCRGELATKTQRGAEVYELMKLGALTGLSIGFRPTTYELDEKKKVRSITEVDLFEISPVTIPGNGSARVEDVKSLIAGGRPQNIRYLEQVLRDAGLSRSEAKAVLADGFKALALRDAAADDVIEALNRAAARVHP